MEGVLFQIRWSGKALLGRVHIYEGLQEMRERCQGKECSSRGNNQCRGPGAADFAEEQQRGQCSWSRRSRRVSSRSEVREASRRFTESERGSLWRVE